MHGNMNVKFIIVFPSYPMQSKISVITYLYKYTTTYRMHWTSVAKATVINKGLDTD